MAVSKLPKAQFGIGMAALEAKKLEARKKAKKKVVAKKPVMKSGGSTDKKWIQKAVNPAHKGYCTPMTKPTCTPKRKALAKTLKAMAKNR